MPIYMRITVNGKGAELTISRKSSPDRWCSKSHRENGTKDSTKALNAYLDELQRQLVQAHLKLIDEQRKITALSLKNKLRNKADRTQLLIEIFNAHNAEMESLIGIDYEPNTLNGYQTTINHLTSYIKTKYKKPDLEIDQLDYSFIRDFDYY